MLTVMESDMVELPEYSDFGFWFGFNINLNQIEKYLVLIFSV